MVEKENNFNYSIKGKLISAVAMLMVAVIMVVSSTYAWFTLSTAPEVTGISTAVGANGALEMLLLTKDETGAWVYNEGILDANKDENTYWGNLVDLSKSEYGSNMITLYPSMLNIDGMFEDGVKVRENIVAGDVINDTNPIMIPTYNANGRPTATKPAGQFGALVQGGSNFVPNDNAYGFRALGVASGLTGRQQAFRAALGEIATNQNGALTDARNSLANNGTTLAAIAVKKAMNDAPKFTQDDINSINSMLNGLESSLEKIEIAYIQSIVAAALSNKNTANDEAAEALAGTIRAYLSNGELGLGERVDAAINSLGTLKDTVTALLSGYDTFTSAVEDVLAAKDLLEDLETKTEYEWNDFSTALTYLVNTEAITINGVTVPDIKTDAGKSQVAGDILGGKGVSVNIPTGGGVYADVADLCEDFQVDITIDSGDLNVGVNDMSINAKMKADSTSDNKYLNNLRNAINLLYPASQGENTTQPLTEFYGYVIDLAFKTNAAQSNLLLQYDGTDRIYSDNNNEATMGGGSTMTFQATTPDFTTEQVKALMGNLRVVFFNPDGCSIYAEARLDMSDVTIDAAGVTAQIKIWETVSNVYSYKETSTSPAITVYAKTVEYGADTPDDTADDKTVTEYYSDKAFSADKLVVTSENISADATLTQIKQKFADQDDAVISSLDQNQIHHVSALVYLDGESITNKDVAATAASSMTGTVNLQFASSAQLSPMEYGDLHTPEVSE